MPTDAAGAFKAEGLGISLFDYVRADDPSALIGLPLIALTTRLREFGIDPLSGSPDSYRSSSACLTARTSTPPKFSPSWTRAARNVQSVITDRHDQSGSVKAQAADFLCFKCAAVFGIAQNRMTLRLSMHPYLMSAPGM